MWTCRILSIIRVNLSSHKRSGNRISPEALKWLCRRPRTECNQLPSASTGAAGVWVLSIIDLNLKSTFLWEKELKWLTLIRSSSFLGASWSFTLAKSRKFSVLPGWAAITIIPKMISLREEQRCLNLSLLIGSVPNRPTSLNHNQQTQNKLKTKNLWPTTYSRRSTQFFANDYFQFQPPLIILLC